MYELKRHILNHAGMILGFIHKTTGLHKIVYNHYDPLKWILPTLESNWQPLVWQSGWRKVLTKTFDSLSDYFKRVNSDVHLSIEYLSK